MSENNPPPSESSATNPFDDELRQAQKKNLVVLIGLGVGLLTFLLGYFFWLFLTRGYAIEVLPAKAAQHFTVVVEQGSAFELGGRVYTFGGAATVGVDAPFFEPEQVEILPGSPSTIQVTLKPSPFKLMASTVPESAQTQWLIDGQAIATGETLEHLLTEGQYTLKAVNSLYKPVEQTVRIGEQETTKVVLNLEAVPVRLTIQTQPSGAEVELNGRPYGKTPVTVQTQSGRQSVSLKLADYQTLTDSLQLRADQPQVTKQYPLKRLQATIEVSVLDPTDGVLQLNGQTLQPGKHSIDSKVRHTLTYSKPGYLPFSESFNLNPESKKTFNIRLKHSLGKVTFESSPSAEVWVGGALLGQGKQVVTLKTIKQTVEFKKKGYRTVTRQFTPSLKRSLLVRVKLQTEQEAKRAEGGKTMAQQLGIQLVRQRFGPMTMGSPPNERGRFRNEFQYSVRFTRPVLVGRFEVTEAQYQAFDPSRPASKNPVTSVSWNDAARFANWLSAQDGLPLFYRVQGQRVVGFNPQTTGYRLLSEAEWEWVAKASKRRVPTPYVWGSQAKPPEGAGNYGKIPGYKDSHVGVAPVGSYQAERAGIHDLSGNVSEWVHDVISYSSPSGVQTNYLGPRSGQAHVIKGGSFESKRITDLRAAKRTAGSGPQKTVGFRIARYER